MNGTRLSEPGSSAGIKKKREGRREGARAAGRKGEATEEGETDRAARAAASHAKQKSLSLRLNMIPHLLSMY